MWCAWAIKHDSHGECLSDICFLPDDKVPETNHNWVRCPWLDEHRADINLSYEEWEKIDKAFKKNQSHNTTW